MLMTAIADITGKPKQALLGLVLPLSYNLLVGFEQARCTENRAELHPDMGSHATAFPVCLLSCSA